MHPQLNNLSRSPNETREMFIDNILKLAREEYFISLQSDFRQHFDYYLVNIEQGIPNSKLFSPQIRHILKKYFHDEYLLAARIFETIQWKTPARRPTDEIYFLTELILTSHWQFDFLRHEQEDSIELIGILEKLITVNFALSPADFKPNLITHLKFLAFRVLKKEQDTHLNDAQLYFFLQERYPVSFQAANRIRVFITEGYDFDLSNDEICFLMLHFRKLLAQH